MSVLSRRSSAWVVFLFGLFSLGLLGEGCRLRGKGAAVNYNEGAEPEGSGASGTSPQKVERNFVEGFSSWGGIASSKTYRHLSDPNGLLLGRRDLKGPGVRGGNAVNPSEVLAE